MQQVVVTVEALRCHQCRRLISPHEDFYQHQALNSVTVGYHDRAHTYIRADICSECHTLLVRMEKEDQQRAWWRRLWIGTLLINLIVMAFLPVGLFPWYGALIVRAGWKWRMEHQQQAVTEERRAA
jgi:hypothetical protein